MNTLEGKALFDHGKAIARRYARLVGAEVADELRAEALTRVLRSPPPDGRLEPWLERIYRNLLIDRWRRGEVAVPTSDMDAFAGPRTPEDDLLDQERRRAVRAGLRQLPRESRRVLLSRYYGERKDDDVATQLGIATATVRTRVHRALAQLRLRLGDALAWFPPLLGKLGTSAAPVALAPVLAAVLVIGRATPPTPPALPEIRSVTALAAPPAQGPKAPSMAKEPTPVLAVPPAAPPRTAKRLPSPVPATPPPRATEVPPAPPSFGDLLQPDGLDVFAEPARPVHPCLISPPPSLVAQVDKMLEDLL